MIELLNNFLNFLQIYAIQLLWFSLSCITLYIIVKSEAGRKWIIAQIEWFKLFFAEDKTPLAPSHKNLIGVLMAVVFSVAFLKKVVGADDVPDIPGGWQLVILGILGIRALQSAAEKAADAKYKSANGNGNGNGHGAPLQPEPYKPPSPQK